MSVKPDIRRIISEHGHHWEVDVQTESESHSVLEIYVNGPSELEASFELQETHLKTISEVLLDFAALKQLYIKDILEYRTDHLGEGADPHDSLSEFDSTEIECLKKNGIEPVLLGYKNYLEMQKWYDAFRLLSIGLEIWFDKSANRYEIRMWGNVKDPTDRVWMRCLGYHGNPKYESGDGFIECG